MISRRNIRVKVMQSLYAIAADLFEKNESEDAQIMLIHRGNRLLDQEIKKSAQTFVGLVHILTQVAQYVEIDAGNRAIKFLPTQEDLNVNTKISGNLFLWDLLNNTTFQSMKEEGKTEEMVDKEWVKRLYQQLVVTEEYKEYLTLENRSFTSDKKMMVFIWKNIMMVNKDLLEYFDDEWNGWEDDKDMMFILMENLFKNHRNINFLQFISNEKIEYAHLLIKTVIQKYDHCMELIKPKLKNWDSDRVAIIDMILLNMGLGELLYFPTIPTKVTINEYIEIAKLYSTPQSGQFVNGVLDNLLKDLVAQNKLRKIDRR